MLSTQICINSRRHVVFKIQLYEAFECENMACAYFTNVCISILLLAFYIVVPLSVGHVAFHFGLPLFVLNICFRSPSTSHAPSLLYDFRPAVFFEMGANKYRTSWEWERWRKCTPLIVSPMQLWNVFSFSKCKKKFICSACVTNWNGIKSREEKRDSAPTLNKNVQHLQL